MDDAEKIAAHELVSELATALAKALRHTKYRRATVEITPTGGTITTLQTLEVRGEP